MKVPGVSYEAGTRPHGGIRPIAGVLHQTFGGWSGSYAVGRYSSGSVASFHFLVGTQEGQAAQFYDTTIRCYHAPGANNNAVGLEFVGFNTPLTPWQIRMGSWIIKSVSDAHGIPLTYYKGGRRAVQAGWTTHASVLGSDHSDFVRQEDWDAMQAAWSGGPALPDARRATAYILLSSMKQQPDMDGNTNPGLNVALLQKVLNCVLNEDLEVNGYYDEPTIQAVVQYQQNVQKFLPGSPRDFPGAVHKYTRLYLCASLENIAKGTG